MSKPLAYNGSGRPLYLGDLYTAAETDEAAALFDGGWRSSDCEGLIEEYEMDKGHAERLCEIFAVYENDDDDDDDDDEQMLPLEKSRS